MQQLTPEEDRKRRQRNVAVAVALLAFVALIFAVTVAKIGGDIARRNASAPPAAEAPTTPSGQF